MEVEDAGGHVAGHLDGVVMHHPTAPKTKHVWESKVVNERKLAKFRKIKGDAGEKATLRQWDFEYWVQAQLYMLHTQMTRHWMVVSASGCRDWDFCRTELDRDQAEYFAERMRSMVANVDELPERVSESPAAGACRFCDFVDVCHEGAAIERNCRTCRFSTPVDGPNWMCGLDDVALTLFVHLLATYGSTVLGMAVMKGRLSAEEAFTQSRLDEIWQIKYWGQDEIAQERTDAMTAELTALSKLL